MLQLEEVWLSLSLRRHNQCSEPVDEQGHCWILDIKHLCTQACSFEKQSTESWGLRCGVSKTTFMTTMKAILECEEEATRGFSIFCRSCLDHVENA